MFSKKFVSCLVVANLRATKAKLTCGLLPVQRSIHKKAFSDTKIVRVVAGKGGDGCSSMLQVWCNERAGPDGGDGGNGGHVIFQSSSEVHSLNHIPTVIKALEGEKGHSKDCHGKNSSSVVVKVPVGTVVRDLKGEVLCNLSQENCSFVSARGGKGGKGNSFFTNSKDNAPTVCEYGSLGEDLLYLIELRSMANVGLIGCPNAGKSTLLNAITRSQSKVAPYEFSTKRAHIASVPYDDYGSLLVADLPGLVQDSDKSKGLGLRFLKHVENCALLLYILDISREEPWRQYNILTNELTKFDIQLASRPKIVIANKIDTCGAFAKLAELEEHISHSVFPLSAKYRLNINNLLIKIREYCDAHKHVANK